MSEPKMPCRDIAQLSPVLQRGANEFLKRCKAEGLNVLITQTYRSTAYQNSLYQQGRTVSGGKVTNLDGYKNTSPHQHRIAFDICQNNPANSFPARLPKAQAGKCFWQRCGAIWKAMGGVWGGDWSSFEDNPHFEFTDNKGYTPFRNGYVFPDNYKMPWETAIKQQEEDAEVIEVVNMNVNGVMKPIRRILKDDRNFVELNTLKELGIIELSYDEKTKLVTITPRK